MWDETLEEDESMKRRTTKQIHPTGYQFGKSPEASSGLSGLFNRFFGADKDQLPKVNKVHGATYTLPINDSDVKPEEIQNGKSKQEIALSKDVQENKYNVDEMRLQEQISQVTKSLKKTEVVGSLHHSGPNTPKPKFEKKMPPKLGVDNLKSLITVNDDVTMSPGGKPKNLNTSQSLKELESVSHNKIKQFRALLDEENLDLSKLCKLSWSGIPSEYRSISWKILTGYVPLCKVRREATIARKRKEYWDYVSKFYDEKGIKKSENEVTQLKQIQVDVPRTNPDLDLFQQERVQGSLERILYVWSLKHPASGYVQGINDLVSPFLTVFLSDCTDHDVLKCDSKTLDDSKFKEAECDAFWCFSLFMDFIQDHYTFAQPGIQRMVQKLEYIMSKIDADLHSHLVSERVDFIHFSFRWMNCLLMRELPLKLIIRLFDTYLSETESFATLHVYVCAAFLKTWSTKLKTLEYADMIMFLQKAPTQDWTMNEVELLLSQAYMLKSLYNENKHLDQ